MLPDRNLVPQLHNEFISSFKLLEDTFLNQCERIGKWFEDQWNLYVPPVYGSVDLRNAGFKLAPIDMNLFPAGFNNLNPDFLSLSIKAAKKIIERISPNCRRILIIPESHTRNIFYWQNVKTLQKILLSAGFESHLGSLSEEIKKNLTINLENGEEITLEPLLRKENKLYVENFCPEVILLNNDLSEGIPVILQNAEQEIIPPAELGWSQRLKSYHFQYYAQVADEFAKHIDIDPWFIAPLFRHCGQIDFLQQSGMTCLVENAEVLFEEISKKYQQYQISHDPFVIVKADAGTYGMAVMTVRNADELKKLNRKQRTRMAATKGGQPVNRVIIQEGVYTFETLGQGNAVAEPVVYLWGDSVIGGFYRVHKERGIDENLNAPGMHFEPIAFTEACDRPCPQQMPKTGQNRFYIYGIIAQLSMLAAAREIKDQVKNS